MSRLLLILCSDAAGMERGSIVFTNLTTAYSAYCIVPLRLSISLNIKYVYLINFHCLVLLLEAVMSHKSTILLLIIFSHNLRPEFFIRQRLFRIHFLLQLNSLLFLQTDLIFRTVMTKGWSSLTTSPHEYDNFFHKLIL